MLKRLWPRSAYDVMAAVAFVAVIAGATAYAAATIGADDIKSNAVRSKHIKNGQVSVLDTRKTIPSGATVTGALGALEDAGGGAGNPVYVETVDFHGLRAPADLTDADVNFDNAGVSATAALDSEESAGCTGGVSNPTAPRGKVCIYLFFENVRDGSAVATQLGFGSGSTQADRYGFVVQADNTATYAQLGGTWAYRAP